MDTARNSLPLTIIMPLPYDLRGIVDTPGPVTQAWCVGYLLRDSFNLR